MAPPKRGSRLEEQLPTGTDEARGILVRVGARGVLRDSARPSFAVSVPPELIRAHALSEGALVTGSLRQGPRGAELVTVASICGAAPEAYGERTPFNRLIAVDPDQRYRLEAGGETAMRILDLVAPIGRGTRGLIVAPPKAGKTTLLEQVARGVRAAEPQARIVALLIDERPEEVTYFRREVAAEVFASSSDQPVREHVALAELMLAHVRTELECGNDVVVLVDSLTRLVRAFNREGRNRSRTLTGGLDAAALEIPRRFFGTARNIENGGSVTILATVLVDTGSRMDQLIYEEFKATGNSEVVLDRGLAEAGVFPAIDVTASGTRKEERLYGPEDSRRLNALRRALAERRPRESMDLLLRLLAKYVTNEELLQSIRV